MVFDSHLYPSRLFGVKAGANPSWGILYWTNVYYDTELITAVKGITVQALKYEIISEEIPLL